MRTHAALIACLVLLLTGDRAGAQEGHASAPGGLEGRPASGQTSPLQHRVDAASPGETIEVAAGVYAGDLFIDKPMRLVGIGRPRLVGSGTGSVVRVRGWEAKQAWTAPRAKAPRSTSLSPRWNRRRLAAVPLRN